MRNKKIIYRGLVVALTLLASGLVSAASAQTASVQLPSDTPGQEKRRTTVVLPKEKAAAPVTGRANLYCGGFIQYAPAPIVLEVVGGEEEQEQRVYSLGDYVYINAGANQGIRAGQEFSVTRPRGQFKSKFSKKDGWLGVYTQEIGALRVTEVKTNVSVAIVTQNCDTILLGDLLRALPQRVAPIARQETEPLNRFKDPNGKQNGRIVLARDGREALSRDQVVFIDLGTEDNVKPGDYFTVYRKLGKGNILHYTDDEVAVTASSGFESDEFKGGRFSNQAQRVKDANETGVYGPTTSTPRIKKRRPKLPRKIVGELVVLSVQQRTATAVITRAAQEIHTGDHVELQ